MNSRAKLSAGSQIAMPTALLAVGLTAMQKPFLHPCWQWCWQPCPLLFWSHASNSCIDTHVTAIPAWVLTAVLTVVPTAMSAVVLEPCCEQPYWQSCYSNACLSANWRANACADCCADHHANSHVEKRPTKATTKSTSWWLKGEKQWPTLTISRCCLANFYDGRLNGQAMLSWDPATGELRKQTKREMRQLFIQ